jgi:pyroglutamyl-peptidase
MDGLGMIHPKVRESVADLIETPFVFPEDILEAIRRDGTAWKNFLSFPEPYRRIRVAYVDAARKRPAEFEKRLGNLITKSGENKMIAGYGGIDVYYYDHGKTAPAILVTAFEPFGGEKINPTELILRQLPDRIGAFALKKALLPVEFVRAREIACAEYDKLGPSAVVMLGQAGGRTSVTPETTGKNLMNAKISDNAGYEPRGVPVSEGGPETLRSTADVAGIVDAVRALGIPCEISDDAGAYVCNALLYGMLEHNGGTVPTVFIHVPFVREQGHADKPFMELDDIYRAVVAAVGSVAEVLGSGKNEADGNVKNGGRCKK